MSAHLIVQSEAPDASQENASPPKRSDAVNQRLQFPEPARVDNVLGAINLGMLVALLGIAAYFAIKYLL